MKTNTHTPQTSTPAQAFAHACLGSCRRLLAQIAKAKESILAEFRETFAARETMLRLVVNEAEALAWETPYPQLFFPALAMEKVQALTGWETHQRSISRINAPLPLSMGH